jgi:hypothetical protein
LHWGVLGWASKNILPTRECFLSSIPHGFSGEENQFGEMACSVTIPPLGDNQFIPGQKGHAKNINFTPAQNPEEKKYKSEGNFHG